MGRKPPMNGDGLGEHCAYCDRELEAKTSLSKLAATKDHVFPASRGGRHLVWCCRQCNSLKADMLPLEWADFMIANPEWWTRSEFERGTLIRHITTMSEAVDIANASTDPRLCITADHRFKPRPAIGFWATLTDEQKEAALAYDGPEYSGPPHDGPPPTFSEGEPE